MSPDVVAHKLANDGNFKTDVLQYLARTVHEEYPDGVVPDLPKEKGKAHVCSERPVSTTDPIFKAAFAARLQRLVKKCNTHKHTQTCYKYGYENCRFGFERPKVEIAKIVNGVIFLKRSEGSGWVNNYNDIITSALGCNTDIKFICNGNDSKSLAFYITDYITKRR